MGAGSFQEFVGELLKFAYENFYAYKKKRSNETKNLHKTINSPNRAIDMVVETLYEICPHPYHV